MPIWSFCHNSSHFHVYLQKMLSFISRKNTLNKKKLIILMSILNIFVCLFVYLFIFLISLSFDRISNSNGKLY